MMMAGTAKTSASSATTIVSGILIAGIGAVCREKGVFFHTDAVQGIGKLPFDVAAMNVDLVSISAHKMYGPKGIGALYVRRKPRVRLVPLIVGGGQERGFRSGTLPTPLCVGLGEAAEICSKEMEAEAKRLKKLQERMLKGLQSKLTDLVVNGDLDRRIPGNLNISFAYVEGESLMMGIKGLSVSSGSACTSASHMRPHTIRRLRSPIEAMQLMVSISAAPMVGMPTSSSGTPASIRVQTMGRAAPPAPSTTTGPASGFHLGTLSWR